MNIAIGVVDARNPGNVGTIARAMKNFGMEQLYLVDPPEIEPDGEAYGFAGRAREDVLPQAKTVSFQQLIEGFHTVGFTAVTNEDASSHVRFPFKRPDELAESLRPVETDTCLIFGRENNGLSNEELARVDEIAAIPANESYPVLNLGQAATVAMYECRTLAGIESQLPDVERERADEGEIDRLYEMWRRLLAAVDHPVEKRAKTMRMFRRVIGRTHPTRREAVTMLGVLRRTCQRVERSDDPD